MATRKRFQFLCRFVPELFGQWSRAKISELNETYVATKLCRSGDVVYDIGEPADHFYIVREGRLEFETAMEIETALKLPVDDKNWEVKRKRKTIQYHIRHVNAGEYFGHEEILNGLEIRQTRVKCLASTQLLQIKKAHLLK
jgi:CRP-like cAMP-binding protein